MISQPAGGSPMYRLLPEHGAAVLALVAMLLAGWWLVRRSREPRAPLDVLLAGLLAASAAVHLGLALGDLGHDGATRALFLADAALLGIVARRVWRGARAGRLGVAVLVGSIVAYWGVSVGGHAPDQLAILTKLAEVVALAIVARPRPDDRRAVRSALRAAAIVVLVVGTSAATWAGAFRAASATQESVSGHHVHDGGVAPPGTLLPAFPDREPTAAERLAATQLISAARAALARYADPAVAAADGYRVAGLHGIDFHAPNPAYEKDGRVLDPAHPETLVYALAPDGRAVLMGALFQMSELGEAGPAIGGPLTTWHAHEHVCISLTPPALAGVQSPLGMCPLGSVDVPMTAQMIHLWIVPGAPQPFGDLDDAWKRAYLEGLARGD